MQENTILFYPDYYVKPDNRIYLISDNEYLAKTKLNIVPTKNFSLKYYKSIQFKELIIVILYLIDFLILKLRVNKSLTASYLKFRKVNKVIVICSYDNLTTFLLKHFKKLGIKTLELQHGHIVSEHKFYKKGLEYIDEFWCWNSDYEELIKSFKNNIITKNIGLPFHKKGGNKSKLTIKNILIIDQWSIRDEIINIILDIKYKYPQLNLIYKLHPNKMFWPKSDLLEDSDIRVIKTKVRIIDMVSNYDAVLGAYSTGLIEAALCGIPSFVVSGYEDEILIKNNTVKTFEEFISKLDWDLR